MHEPLLEETRLVTIRWSDGSSEGWDPRTQVYPISITVERTVKVVDGATRTETTDGN